MNRRKGFGLEAEASPGAAGWALNWSDWRVWLGMAVTAVCVWLAVRGIPLAEVVRAIRESNFWSLLALSAPCYLMSLYFRALRWRHLGVFSIDLRRWVSWPTTCSRCGSEKLSEP